MEYYLGQEFKTMRRIGSRISSSVTTIAEGRPLLFFGVCGIIAIVVGIIFGVRVVNYLAEKEVLLTGTALISGLLLGTGVFSIFTGIILRTLSRRSWDKD